MTTPARPIARSALLAVTLAAMIGPEVAWPHQDQNPPGNPNAQQQQQHREDKQEQKNDKKKSKRVSQQEQQERIRKQEANLQVYRQNLALKEELAERNAKILQQQRRLAQYRFQQRYYERLRQQRAQLMAARYDYYNDPFYYTAPNYRYRRDGRYYMTNEYGIDALKRALNEGYREGFEAGRADREDRWRFDYQSSFAYQDANFGYDGRYLRQDEYNHYFREGFRRGYEDGYYGRKKYGSGNEDDDNDGWLIAGVAIAAILGYELLTD